MKELFDEPGLFVLCNGSVANLTTDKIFDASRFTKFYGVSYVSGPKFFTEVARDFKEVTFILGIPDTDVAGRFTDKLNGILTESENGAVFFNSLTG